jgi:hypothetical protein
MTKTCTSSFLFGYCYPSLALSTLDSNPSSTHYTNLLPLLFLNQYHQEFLGTPPWKGVGLVCVKPVIFIFNCCKLMDNPISCIDKTQTTTTWYSYSVSMPIGPCFLVFVLPYKWSNSEVRSMFHHLFAFLKDIVPFSTTAMASSNCSLVHLLLMI